MNSGMKVLQILPLKKQAFAEELTYFTKENIEVGDIVSITIKTKKSLGLVVSIENLLDLKSKIKNMNFNIKKIAEKKEISIFRKEFLEAVFLTSKYFIVNKNYMLSFLIPSIIKENYDLLAKDYDISRNTVRNSEIKSEKLLFQNSKEERIDYYKRYIRGAFANKESIFIVLPTDHSLSEFEENLNKGIEKFVYTLSNNLNKNKLLEKIKEILQNPHPVVIIGTPQFLSIPILNLKTIIIEEENSNSYKTFQKPFFDLRIFIEIFASKINAKLILADKLLRFETIERIKIDNLNELEKMSYRLPYFGEITILDKNKIIKNTDREEKKFEILDEKSILEIKKTLTNKGKIFVFALRKGLATFTVCKDCQNEVLCKDCKSPLVLYQTKSKEQRIFLCNKCKKEENTMNKCIHCDGWNLVPLGIGIDKIKEELEKNIKNVKIFQLDKTNIKNNKEAIKVINEFYKTENSILLGTEMAFFYLREKVDLSMIASFDSLFTIPNFKINEKVINILFNTIDITRENLIIETRNPENEAILSIKNKNLLNYINEELQDRKILKYPPYVRFIKLTYFGNSEENLKVKKFIEENFNEYNPIIFKSSNGQTKNKTTVNILIKLNRENWSTPNLISNSHIDEELYKKLNYLEKNFDIQIDPENLL